MSWQAYVTDFLMTPGDMVAAGIYGLDGGEWASQGCVKPQPKDITRLISIIKDQEKDLNGIKIDGVSYLHISHDSTEGSIRLSRINAPETEKYSCTGFLSNQCFVFGVVSGGYKLGNCNKFSCKLRDYLRQVGY